MRLLARFTVNGRPSPWSVPAIGTGRSKAGKRFRFLTSSKALRRWQGQCKGAAKAALAGRATITGPVMLRLEFTREAPEGVRPGTPWFPDVVWNDDKKRFVKVGKGAQIPDLTNLFKGTEDAIQGTIFGDDGQSCVSFASRLYGKTDGVRVSIYAIEPQDYPGEPDGQEQA
jgi:Holliday junction resolvase RusA-like endonuclease